MNWTNFLGLSQASGPNGDSASIQYDSNARPSSSTSPYGAVTTYGYNVSPPYTVATTNGHYVTTSFDGFGRAIRVDKGYMSGNNGIAVSSVITNYAPCGCSPLGKVSQVSQPFAPGGTEYLTTYVYDGLGRKKSVSLPDGSVTAYSYAGNQVTVTDAAGHSKTFSMDVFGNLIAVQETDPQLGSVATNYTYDVLNHLIQVSMPRNGYTQTRTFNYNSGNTVTGLLQSASNPENGTVSYSYSNNLLASKTDAKGQTINYSYDGYNRLSQVSSGGSSLRTYYYDSNPYDPNGNFSHATLGRLAAVLYGSNWNGCTVSGGLTFADWYSYVAAGGVAAKRLQVAQMLQSQNQLGYWNYNPSYLNFDESYTYNSEGSVASEGSNSYAFDAMGRPAGLTDSNNNLLVSNVVYGPSNELLGMTYSSPYISGTVNEMRTYNSLGQLTWIGAGWPVGSYNVQNESYTYPAGTDIGKISSKTDNLSGETVQYSYDSLNRMVAASASSWSESYSFDGFGNLTAKNVTGSSPAPPLSVGVDPLHNRVVGVSYDANGNVTSSGGIGGYWQASYDVENRMIFANGVGYAYDSQNHRILQEPNTQDSYGNPTGYTVYFWGANGRQLGSYQVNVSNCNSGLCLSDQVITQDVYFGGRRLAPLDRVGSARTYLLGGQQSFYPYGEDKGTPGPNDNWKFGSYWRDSATGLDYANQRYYSSQLGRFMSADRYSSSASLSNPQSWNRYAYASNDPANRIDPAGADDCDPESSIDCYCQIYGSMDPHCDPNYCPNGICSGPGVPGPGGPLPQIPCYENIPYIWTALEDVEGQVIKNAIQKDPYLTQQQIQAVSNVLGNALVNEIEDIQNYMTPVSTGPSGSTYANGASYPSPDPMYYIGGHFNLVVSEQDLQSTAFPGDKVAFDQFRADILGRAQSMAFGYALHGYENHAQVHYRFTLILRTRCSSGVIYCIVFPFRRSSMVFGISWVGILDLPVSIPPFSFTESQMRSKILGSILFAAALGVNVPTNLSGGDLRKIWEVNLGDIAKIPGGPDAAHRGITALRFSPDGTRIAVAEHLTISDKSVGQLSVIHVEHQNEKVRRFEIGRDAIDSIGITPAPSISWSPNQDFLLAGSTLVRLMDDSTCRLPNNLGTGVLPDGRIIGLRTMGHDGIYNYRFDFFDSACQSTGTWELEGVWILTDVSLQRGLVSARRADSSKTLAGRTFELLVIDPLQRKILQRWPDPLAADARFADNSNALCTGNGGPLPGDLKEIPPHCLDIGTGQEIGEPDTVIGGTPLVAAEKASRVVLSDRRAVWNFFYREYDNVLKRRVIWDFRSGQEIASWKPQTQSYVVPRHPKPRKDLFPFAISPNGEYLAEGGNGILRLYKIEP